MVPPRRRYDADEVAAIVAEALKTHRTSVPQESLMRPVMIAVAISLITSLMTQAGNGIWFALSVGPEMKRQFDEFKNTQVDLNKQLLERLGKLETLIGARVSRAEKTAKRASAQVGAVMRKFRIDDTAQSDQAEAARMEAPGHWRRAHGPRVPGS